MDGRLRTLLALLPTLECQMMHQDITKLIVRTSMKDRAAFDELYRHTSAKLFGVCLRILKDRGEAEEALQEVFVNRRRTWARELSATIHWFS